MLYDIIPPWRMGAGRRVMLYDIIPSWRMGAGRRVMLYDVIPSWRKGAGRRGLPTETIRLIRDGEKGGREYGGGVRRLYTYCYTVDQNDSCIKTDSAGNHFNISLIVRDKVTRQCPQTTTFLKRGGEPKRNRAEALLLISLTLTAGPNRLTMHCRCGFDVI